MGVFRYRQRQNAGKITGKRLLFPRYGRLSESDTNAGTVGRGEEFRKIRGRNKEFRGKVYAFRRKKVFHGEKRKIRFYDCRLSEIRKRAEIVG